jgi:4-hydroxy-tetrahydrodipicolinate synthase
MSWEYSGILAAMQLPFAQDLSIDEPELRRFTNWLAGHKGIGGLGWGLVLLMSRPQNDNADVTVSQGSGGVCPMSVNLS